MTHPNFFLAGTPKAGTTALYTYLLNHPNIFLPLQDGGSVRQKEPNYFATDIREDTDITSETYYHKLYEAVGDEHFAIGDCSILYLYSAVALENIRTLVPDAKIIIVLRNPIEAVVSYHSELYKTLSEDEPSLEVAWSLQEARRQGKMIPSTCRSPARLQYRHVYDYPTQIERLWRLFPKEQTLVLLYDELKADMAEVYMRIQSFLELPSHALETFDRVNENKVARSRLLAKLLLRPPSWLKRSAELMKTKLGINYTVIAVRLTEMNLASPGEQKVFSHNFCEQLIETFEPDIRHLSVLLDRDMSTWTAEARNIVANA